MKRTPLRQRGRKAAAKHRADFGPQAERCHDLPCFACVAMRLPQPSPTEAHHEPPRSRGGTDHHAMPLCRYHHRLRHDVLGERGFWALLAPITPTQVLEAMRSGAILPGDPADAIPY